MIDLYDVCGTPLSKSTGYVLICASPPHHLGTCQASLDPIVRDRLSAQYLDLYDAWFKAAEPSRTKTVIAKSHREFLEWARERQESPHEFRFTNTAEGVRGLRYEDLIFARGWSRIEKGESFAEAQRLQDLKNELRMLRISHAPPEASPAEIEAAIESIKEAGRG